MSDTDGPGTQGGDAARWPTLAGSDPAPAARRSRRAADPADASGATRDPGEPRPVTGAHAAVPAPVAASVPVAPPASAASAPVASDGDTTGAPSGGTPGRSRALLIGGIVAAVLVVAGGVTAFLLLRDDSVPAAEAPPAVQLPSPTSTVAPAERPATTPFASALPATLLQYALATSADDPEWLALNAVEAYTDTYTDGGSGTVEVRAGQWDTPETATSVAASLTAALPAADAAATGEASDGASSAAGAPTVLLQGDVLVGGAATGTVTVLDLGDGTGVAVWNNGTTVFRLTGPAADIQNLYAAYPL
jgi:hypothetical protein